MARSYIKKENETPKHGTDLESYKAIVAVNRMARGMGLSYGQFVAQYGDKAEGIHPPKPAADPEPVMKTYKRHCVMCGREFTAHNWRAAYCSDMCRRRQDSVRKFKSMHSMPDTKSELIEKISKASNMYGDLLVAFMDKYKLQSLKDATVAQLTEYIKEQDIC